MKLCSIGVVVVVALLIVCCPTMATPPVAEAATAVHAEPTGMERLFNGKDLTGWDGDPRLWSVREGAIHGETTPENVTNGNTFLIWQGGELGDFEVRLSFRCNAANNSGIQYRSRHITDESARNKWVVRGYQHEIRNENTLPNVPGFIYDEGGKRGRICQVGEQATWGGDGKQVVGNLINADEFKGLMKIDDWNDVVIRAEGDHIRHWLNGRLVLDFTDKEPSLALSKGVLALQLHAGKPMWVEFRDIRLKRLEPRLGDDQGAEAERLAELDQLWAEVSRAVNEGDFAAYSATCHPEGVLVSETKGFSQPLATALKRWRQEFLDTQSGRITAEVEMRFSRRLGDATTAHETGIFRYSAGKPGEPSMTDYVPFQSLLVKHEGRWRILMEHQLPHVDETAWNRLKD